MLLNLVCLYFLRILSPEVFSLFVSLSSLAFLIPLKFWNLSARFWNSHKLTLIGECLSEWMFLWSKRAGSLYYVILLTLSLFSVTVSGLSAHNFFPNSNSPSQVLVLIYFHVIGRTILSHLYRMDI